MDPDTEILFDSPFIRVHKGGRVERYEGTEVAPASVDPVSGVSSKDILVTSDTGVSARVYLAKLPNDERPKKLPLLVYFHGGGFCTCRAFNPPYHNYLNSLAAQANVVAVSVDYRLAPEHPIPTAYDDSWAALQWVASHAESGDEEWLANHADFGRVFLAGDSAGATIAHQMAMRAGVERLESGVKINGLALIHPYFLGTNWVESDAIDPAISEGLRIMWEMVCPSTTGFDDPRINPLAKDVPSLSSLACKWVLVCVGEMDVLRDRGRAYYEGLKASGRVGDLELLESEGEGHVFHFSNPTCEKAVALCRAICRFVNLN